MALRRWGHYRCIVPKRQASQRSGLPLQAGVALLNKQINEQNALGHTGWRSQSEVEGLKSAKL